VIQVHRDLIDEIRAHVRSSIRPSREIVGVLVIDAYDKAVRYERLRNRARGDETFAVSWNDMKQVRLNTGEWRVVVHSHPSDRKGRPSKGDLRGAHRSWLGIPYAIFVVPKNRLMLFELATDRASWKRLAFDRVPHERQP
jgi:proteasome lid subunit RPN8/RPN11